MTTTPDNIDRLQTRLASVSLTTNQRHALINHLLGGVADHVDAGEWDAAVERAVRFAAPSPVETAGCSS